MEDYCIRMDSGSKDSKEPIYHVTSNKTESLYFINIKNKSSDENRHNIAFYIDMKYLSVLSKNYLMRLLNEQLKHCILGSEIEPVTEDEAARIICAAKDGRESISGWLKVCKFLGVDSIAGQGDVSFIWCYVCFDTENKKYITVSEDKNWSRCSPDLHSLQKQILNHEEPYFYTSYGDYGQSCDGYIATLDGNITENLVRMGILDLPSSKIKSDCNTNENIYTNRLDNDPDIYKSIDEKDALRKLHETSESIRFQQNVSISYPTGFSYNKDSLVVFLDDNKLDLEKKTVDEICKN